MGRTQAVGGGIAQSASSTPGRGAPNASAEPQRLQEPSRRRTARGAFRQRRPRRRRAPRLAAPRGTRCAFSRCSGVRPVARSSSRAPSTFERASAAFRVPRALPQAAVDCAAAAFSYATLHHRPLSRRLQAREGFFLVGHRRQRRLRGRRRASSRRGASFIRARARPLRRRLQQAHFIARRVARGVLVGSIVTRAPTERGRASGDEARSSTGAAAGRGASGGVVRRGALAWGRVGLWRLRSRHRHRGIAASAPRRRRTGARRGGWGTCVDQAATATA